MSQTVALATPADIEIFEQLLKSWSAQVKPLSLNLEANDTSIITVRYKRVFDSFPADHVNKRSSVLN
jgi:hypothetical protein